MVKPIPIHTAKTNLSRLIVRACAGEEIIISRGDAPVVRLIPVEPVPGRRIPGSMKGQFTTDVGFDDPLSETELSAWEGTL